MPAAQVHVHTSATPNVCFRTPTRVAREVLDDTYTEFRSKRVANQIDRIDSARRQPNRILKTQTMREAFEA
eukprot:1650849-Alexandrium_andersonii.AAC.1